jgi:hypothetical protein
MRSERLYILNPSRTMRAALVLLGLTICGAAQPESFRIGETVETNDGRVYKILSVTGRSAKVACGTSRSELRVYGFDSMTSEAKAAARRMEQEGRVQTSSHILRPNTAAYSVGDTVKTPNGKTGKIESIAGDVAKVSVGAGSDYVVVQDLTKIETEPQRTFRVGDTVIASGGTGVVEELSADGKGAKVRFGKGKYDFKWVVFADMRTPAEGRREAEQEKLAKLFSVEAKPYLESVAAVEQFYNPKAMDLKGSRLHGDDRKKVASDLTALDQLCTSKYAGIANESWPNPNAEVPLYMRKGDQCAIAKDREQIMKKAKARVLTLSTEHEIDSWSYKLGRLSTGIGYLVPDDVQVLIYDRAGWEQANVGKIKKEYTDEGETLPAAAFSPLYKIADEVKAKIAADVATRTWKQPRFSDAALEALGRRELAGDFPGAKAIRIGMTYTTWEVRDESTFVGSDSVWRYYRITPGSYRYKNGELLAQLPNRPFCQMREFTVTQRKAGGGYGAAKAYGSTAGTFVKCP